MSNNSKRIEGAAEEVSGTIQKVVGKIVGNEKMQAAGLLKQKQGEAKQAAAKAAERAKGKVEEIVGAVKKGVGAAIGNEKLEAEGKVKELEGEARRKAND